jgi:hypothetical protein
MKRYGLIYGLLLLLLSAVVLPGCDGVGPGGTQVWIDVPLDGVELEAGIIPVQSHAASRSGIASVELRVNGVLYRTDASPTPDEPVIYVVQPWVVTGPGEYRLEVVAVANDESPSPPDSVTVRVIGEAATPVLTPTAEFLTPTPTPVTPTHSPIPPTFTPVTPTHSPIPPTFTPIPPTHSPIPPTFTPIPPTDTPTPVPTPTPQISFWADDTSLGAGNCTTIHWQTANVVAVHFNGQPVVGEGTHKTCPCSTETHTLEVELPDGSTDIRTLTINVTGTCVTPSPTPDRSPPPAPVLQSPANGHKENCAPPQITLVWQAVSDPSGIAAYDVEVNYKPYGSWEPYFSDRLTKVTPGTMSFALEPVYPHTTFACRTYRWRVRAVDGAGNEGPWSGWFEFTFQTIVK